jgi:hypothetical protein
MKAILLSVVCGLALAGCKDPIASSPPPGGEGAAKGGPAPSTPSGKTASSAPGQGITNALTSGSGAVTPSSASSGASRPSGEGFVRTPSGLEYEVLSQGQGETPPLGSRVLVHYTGMLPDGATFASTRGSGGPKEFKLDRMSLIDGWVEALLSMKKGEKRKLRVPSALAYGPRGYEGVVQPNSDLTFELELVAFTPPGGAGRAPR